MFEFECPIIGKPSELKDLLPTYEDAMKFALFQRCKIKQENKNNKEPAFRDIAKTVANELQNMYNKLFIPTISDRRIIQMLIDYNDKLLLKRKEIKRAETSPTVAENIKKFLKHAQSNLFDICSCKCQSFEADKCSCPPHRRVPEEMHSFIIDQRSRRQLVYSWTLRNVEVHQVDYTADVIDNVEIVRNSYELRNINSKPLKLKENFSTDKSKNNDSSSRNTVKVDNTILISDRFGIPIGATAALTTAVLMDFNVVNKENTTKVCDRSKVAREKNRVRKELVNNSEDLSTIKGLYFDGRRDDTLVQVKNGNKYRKSTVKEDHYSLLKEPNSEYIGHVTPTGADANSNCNTIYDYLVKGSVHELTELSVAGCDGTVLNTGRMNGIIRKLEEKLNRPLQWSICLLHFNELPFKHLFQELDGRAIGPRIYTGPIGRKLNTCEQLPVISFIKVDVSHSLEVTNHKDLSSDQKYLYDSFHAVKSGVCSEDLAIRSPGTLNLARWVTTANRILRYYMSEKSPTKKLKIIVKYIMNVYVPFWFTVKLKSSIKDGARHLHKFIKLTRYLDKYLDLIDAVISRNAYFAHPENILLSMLSDHRLKVRQDAIKKIIEARNNNDNAAVCNFHVAPLNYKACEYFEMIDFSSANITPPPVLACILSEQLLQ